MNNTLSTSRSLVLFILVAAFAGSPLVAGPKVEHPLDPLNFQEYWQVLDVLRDAGHVDDKTRFSLVNMCSAAEGVGLEVE